MSKQVTKQAIIEACETILKERISNASHAMQAAQESANGEEKSSAGDKYETSRAMGHRDRDMYARQLVEAQQDLKKLGAINIVIPYKKAQNGAIIEVNNTVYFIALGLGKIMIGDTAVMVISAAAPIAQALLGKQKGDTFTFNKLKQTISNIY